MRTLLILILLGILYLQAMAQPVQVEPLLDSVNRKIFAIQQGYYDVGFKLKLSTKDDTLTGAGRVYFFRQTCGVDSICQFVLIINEIPLYAYDGEYFFSMDHKEKKVNITRVAESGIKLSLKGYAERLLFLRYLRCYGPAIEIEKLVNEVPKIISLTPYEQNGLAKVKFCVIDSFPNEYKLSQADPSIGTILVEYQISLPSYDIDKRVEVINMFENPQYREVALSPIAQMPDSVEFENIFSLKKLEGLGYTQNQKSLHGNQEKHVYQLKLSTGQILDSIFLFDLDNHRVDLPNQECKIVVLDFWYRGCYPCLQALPRIDTLFQKYKDKGVMFYGINGHDPDREKLKNFLKGRDVNYPTLLDSDNALAKKYNIRAYPLMVFLDCSTNKILDYTEGFSPNMVDEISQKLDLFLTR